MSELILKTNSMISKSKIKFIQSLRNKKTRDDELLYVIEGDKLVNEYILSGRTIRLLAAKPDFLNSLTNAQKALIPEIESVNNEVLQNISTLVTPHNALAVVPYTENFFDPKVILNDLSVALEFVQDPGNLGTIIRSAAWFGIKNIVCSFDCVDKYNPKVIQATMGAIMHVNVYYCNLLDFLKEANKRKVTVYGALMEGRSIYSMDLKRDGVILLGNESKGISENLTPFISEKIVIPKFSIFKYGIDSLNVGMAATVFFSEFARRL